MISQIHFFLRREARMVVLLMLLLSLQSIARGEWLNFEPDSSEVFVVDSIAYQINNAFDDVVKYSEAENWVYQAANHLRFKTRQGVIVDNLLFAVGDSTRQSLISETERLLRKQIFLADARIELFRNSENQKVLAKVTTSDKWTTNIPISVSKESEWLWSVGLVEYNTLGLGHQVGFFYSHQLERDLWYGLAGLNHFPFKRNRVDIVASKTTDGYSYYTKSAHPLIESVDRHSYSIEFLTQKSTVYRYWDRDMNTRWRLKNDSPWSYPLGISHDEGIPVYAYEGTRLDTLKGYYKFFVPGKTQFELNALYEYYARYADGGQEKYVGVKGWGETFYLDSSERQPLWTRRNSGFGLSALIRQKRYEKVQNFRKVKWVEDLELGPWAFVGILKNFKSLGARREEWRFQQAAGFSTYLLDRWFVRSRFFNEFYEFEGDVLDGLSVTELESQFRESADFTTVLQSEWKSYYNSAPARQFTLGGFEGLTGFPDFYYSGASVFWFQFEQRYFPSFEWATTMPVMAIFVNGGQSAQQWKNLPWNALDYRVGLGLRLGLTKSTLGIVNHINVSWPINGPFSKSWLPTLSIVAKTSL